MESVKSDQLTKLRQQIADRNKNAGKPCPECGKELTVRATKYFDIEICEKGNCGYAKMAALEQCCRDRRPIHVRKIIANGTVQVKMQCANCGNASGPAIGGYTKEQKEAMPLLDERAREQNEEERTEISRGYYLTIQQLRENRFQQRKSEWWEEYKRYLESPEWKALRLQVLKRDNYLCQACLDAYATQVHHKSYEFVDLKGGEPAFDLVAICVPCHQKIERMKKQ